MLNVSYIDDVVDSLISCLVGKEYKEGKYCYVPNVYKVRLGDIVDLLYSFDKGVTTYRFLAFLMDSVRHSIVPSSLIFQKIRYLIHLR